MTAPHEWQPIATADVERMAELLAKATPGPWVACNQDKGGCICGGVHSEPDESGVAATGSVLEDLFCGQQEEDRERIAANAVLIATAITALPELLRVYLAWLDAPSVQLHLYDDDRGNDWLQCAGPADWAVMSALDGKSVRLVAEGE